MTTDFQHTEPQQSGRRRRIATIASIAIVLLAAIGTTLYFWQPWTASVAVHEHTEGENLYTCPMHPQIVQEGPGVCPICHMDLVPKAPATVTSSDHDSSGAGEMADMVHVTPRDRVIADVQTVKVEYRPLSSQLQVSAGIDYNEAAQKIVSARFGGRIERLYVDETGQSVRKGQPLMDIYSPELVTAQQEYLLARESQPLTSFPGSDADPDATRRREEQARRLTTASRKRLELLGMSASQIGALERRGEITYSTTVFSPAAGTVIDRAVSEGQYVNEGTKLLEIIDLSSVWVLANIYESDAWRVRPGMDMMISGPALGGETLHGKVTFIYPTVDAQTRTVKVRGLFSNPSMRLKPGMYVTATVRVTGRDVITVPVTSVIRTGKRDLVYVEVKNNMFEAREVTLGAKDGDFYEISSGDVKAGDMVVEQGGYLIDSERQLSAGGTTGHEGH